jgi:hypothetical protein
MNKRLTRGTRLLAGVIAIALAFVSTATCLAAAMQMPEMAQHASCHGMKPDAASAKLNAAPKDCCAVQNADVARLTTTDPVVTAPALVLITSLGFEPLPVKEAPGASLDPGIPKPSSSPTYLLVSVFRL